MSKADMVNRTRVGLSYKVEDCAPKGNQNEVSMIFSDDVHDDNSINIRIVETKRGGRTYTTEAVIEADHLKQIAEGLGLL